MKHAAIDYRIPNKTAACQLYIALGLEAKDPGYRQVVAAAQALGELAHFNEGLMYLRAACSIEEAFKQINKSIISTRIASDAPVVLVDPGEDKARWHLNRALSEWLHNIWHEKTNLFVCCAARAKITGDIQALGTSVMISESIWYISSDYAPKEAYQILSGSLDSKDRLTVFDAAGRVMSWQREPCWTPPSPTWRAGDRPTRAAIHAPWQASMLTEFL